MQHTQKAAAKRAAGKKKNHGAESKPWFFYRKEIYQMKKVSPRSFRIASV